MLNTIQFRRQREGVLLLAALGSQWELRGLHTEHRRMAYPSKGWLPEIPGQAALQKATRCLALCDELEQTTEDKGESLIIFEKLRE